MTQEELEGVFNDVFILDVPFQDGKFYVEAYEPQPEDYLSDGNADWQYSVYVDGICVLRTVSVYDVIKTLEEEGYTFEDE